MRKWVGLVALVIIVSLPAAGQTQPPIRVNCGGPSYTDSLGQVWAADYGYNQGTANTLAGPITGTNDPTLYQDGRWNGHPSVPVTHTFPVANGNYHVNLYFTEAVSTLQRVGAHFCRTDRHSASCSPIRARSESAHNSRSIST